MSMKMRYKIIVIGVFVYCILNFPVFNKLTKIIPVPAPHGGPGLYAQEVDVVKLKKEEEERKKKTKKSKYVVTNENLDKIELPKKPYGFVKLGKKETDQAAVSAGGENGSQVETEVPVNMEVDKSTEIVDASTAEQATKEYWQGQVMKIYADIDKTEADIKDNQWELNNLNNQLQAEDIYEKRIQMQKRMEELKNSIPQLKQKLIDLNQAMEDLEDRARKQGILPGWLRVDRPEPMQDQEPKKKQNNGTERG